MSTKQKESKVKCQIKINKDFKEMPKRNKKLNNPS